MKTILVLLLLTAPAMAQSIDPIANGKRFCQLSAMGVEQDAARRAAVKHAYIGTRNAADLNADAAAAAKYVINTCPDALE